MFVTTHSLSVLEGLQEVLSGGDYSDFRATTNCYALQRNQEGLVRSYRYSYSQFEHDALRKESKSGDGIRDWTVFVEGDSDQVLVRSLLQLIGVSDVRTEIIGGGVNHLESVQKASSIGARDVGYRVAMILDANSDPAQRIRDVDDTIKKLCLPVERYFLLPDGQHPGSLQTLLEQMAVPATSACV